VKFFLPYYVNRASEEKFDHQKQLLNLENDWRKIHCPVVILQEEKIGLLIPEMELIWIQ
jgi:hypothetical protein